MGIDIDSVPIGELDPRAPRVLSETPAAKRARERRADIKSGKVPPPKRGAGAKRPRGTPRTPRTPKSLYPEIAAFLTLINTGISLVPPLGSKYEPTGEVSMLEVGPGVSVPVPDMRMIKLGDELDDMEIAHLAKAIDAQCQRSPRFKRYVELVLGMGAGAGILAIVGIIGARRAARHGIIDASLDPKLGAMLNGDLSALANFTPTPERDETPHPETGEVAPVPDDGTDGFRYE